MGWHSFHVNQVESISPEWDISLWWASPPHVNRPLISMLSKWSSSVKNMPCGWHTNYGNSDVCKFRILNDSWFSMKLFLAYKNAIKIHRNSSQKSTIASTHVLQIVSVYYTIGCLAKSTKRGEIFRWEQRKSSSINFNPAQQLENNDDSSNRENLRKTFIDINNTVPYSARGDFW